MAKNCAVCLKNDVLLINNNETNNTNIQMVTKLTECVGEIDWKSNCCICQVCVYNLECAYQFRMQCLHSEAVRRGMETVCEDISDNNDSNIGCFHCVESFTNKTALTEHIQKTHIKKDEEFDVTECEITSDSCLNITTKAQAKNHLLHKCDSCDASFSLLKQLLEHASAEHQIEAKNVKPYKCDKCDAQFARATHLSLHNKYHQGNRCHVCGFCNKGFITKGDLTTHEKQHLNRREYKCDVCSKTFNTHKHLWGHKLNVHTNPSKWAHVCEVCHKRFPIKVNYVEHMRKHTGEKPFACSLCDLRFTDKASMKRHQLSHSRNALKCEYCTKTIRDSQFLEIHMHRVHGVVNGKVIDRNVKHVCSICSVSFFAENTLRRHMEMHQRKLPYGCVVCAERFASILTVRKHLNEAHNIDVNKENE